MKKIILGLIIFLATSLFATDVSNFDIKGIKLGMDKAKALKILNRECSKIDGTVTKSDFKDNFGLIYEYDYRCENNQKTYISISAGFDEKIYSIYYSIYKNYLISNNEENIILNKAKNKYGHPNLYTKGISVKKKGGFNNSYCWGDCPKTSIEIDNSSFWKGKFITSKNSKKYLGNKYPVLLLNIMAFPYFDDEYTSIGIGLEDKNLKQIQEKHYSKKKYDKKIAKMKDDVSF